MYPTELDNLTAESVEGTSLALEGVDNVHGGDGLPLGVLGVCHGITDDILKENLENTAGLLVDESGDTLHSTTTRKTTDCWLGDTLDVITKNFPVTLSATLSESLSSFAAASHVDVSCADTRMKQIALAEIYIGRAAARHNRKSSALIGRFYFKPSLESTGLPHLHSA